MDPFRVLHPQVVVNLLPEFGVGADMMRLGPSRGETFAGGTGWFVLGTSVSAFRSETNEFHKRLSVLGFTAPNPRGPRNHLDGLPPIAASLQMPQSSI